MNSLRSVLLLPALAFFSGGHTTLLAQSIQVRVLDAKSGARVPNEKVSVLLKGEKNARDYTTDNEGDFSLQLDPSAAIYVATEWRITCRTITPGVVPFVPVQTILQEGFTVENTCGKAMQRSTLAWFYGQITLAVESPETSGISLEQWYKAADSWATWVIYQWGFTTLIIGAALYLMAMLDVTGSLPMAIVWPYAFIGAALAIQTIRTVIYLRHEYDEDPIGLVFPFLRR